MPSSMNSFVIAVNWVFTVEADIEAEVIDERECNTVIKLKSEEGVNCVIFIQVWKTNHGENETYKIHA